MKTIMKTTDFYSKRIYKTLILAFLLVSFTALNAQTSSVSEEIIAAIAKGDASQLSSCFDKQVELVVGATTDDTYNKQRATAIVTDFFKKNQVQHFTVIHKDTKDSASFVIGTLKTSNGTFRVYVLTRGELSLIQQLRIEAND
jgi:hypothetical protein